MEGSAKASKRNCPRLSMFARYPEEKASRVPNEKKKMLPLIYYSSHLCLIIQRHEARKRKKKKILKF